MKRLFRASDCSPSPRLRRTLPTLTSSSLVKAAYSTAFTGVSEAACEKRVGAMPSVNRRVLPGFSLSLGYTMFYLSVLVLLPLVACFFRAGSLTFEGFRAAVWSERARAAYLITFGTSLVAAVVNLFLGLLVA